jgi:hypothetical protein
LISIRDDGYKALQDVARELQRLLNHVPANQRARTMRCYARVNDVLAGADDLMREQPTQRPRIAQFNDVPPKGWTGPANK